MMSISQASSSLAGMDEALKGETWHQLVFKVSKQKRTFYSCLFQFKPKTKLNHSSNNGRVWEKVNK